MNKYKEHEVAVGNYVTVEGHKFRCVEHDCLKDDVLSCTVCDAQSDCAYCKEHKINVCYALSCQSQKRKDKRDVIYKAVKKRSKQNG